MSSSTSSRSSVKRFCNKTNKIKISMDNPLHQKLLKGSLSDDESNNSDNNEEIANKTIANTTNKKIRTSSSGKSKKQSKRETKGETKNSKNSKNSNNSNNSNNNSNNNFNSTNNSKKKSSSNNNVQIIFGDDDIDPSELDEKGNIKDLIDYEDEEDYKIYEKEMNRRDEQMKKPGAKIIFSNRQDSEDSEENEDNDSEEYNEESDLEIENEDNEKKDNNYCIDKNDRENMMDIESSQIHILSSILSRPMKAQKVITEAIDKSCLPIEVKKMVKFKLENADFDKPKQMEWVHSLLSIPFGKYANLPVKLEDGQIALQQFFSNTIQKFQEKITGIDNVKIELINYLAQFITSGHKGSPRVLAIYGSPGTGKSFLVRNIIADIMHRAAFYINMGGMKDITHFTGFDYTWASSKYGIIVHCLIQTGIMNPIIVFEEVDKISQSKDGPEIENLLMMLTDPIQNNTFQDKYFAGINIDLSKAMIIFTLNDPGLINPILLNRLHLVRVPDPDINEKISIINDHVLPDLCNTIGFNKELINIPPEIIKYIHTNFCSDDKGMRSLKRCIESIILRLNVIKLAGKDINEQLKISFPITIDEYIVNNIVTKIDMDTLAYPDMYM